MPPAGTATAAGGWEIPGQEALVAMLFPHLTRLRMHRVADAGEAVVISASCRAESACCPRCGQESSRVHGGYSRVVAGGRPVLIALQVRRFRHACTTATSPAEQQRATDTLLSAAAELGKATEAACGLIELARLTAASGSTGTTDLN